MKNLRNQSASSFLALGASLAAAGLLAFPDRAAAQDAPPPAAAAADSDGLGDIIVTAQRRNENLQDVPVSVTAATAEMMDEARVTNIANIQALSPSTSFRNTNNPTTSSNIQIRGVGTAGNSRTFEGAVGVFIDGVYRTRSGQALQSFLDFDGLQILRGPQGTLFGKNTSAGAILLNTTKPATDVVEGSYELSYGNYDNVLAKGAINLPLGDKAAFRMAGLYTKRDGFIKNPNGGPNYNDDEAYAWKGSLLLEPADGVSLRLIGDYSKSNGNCCYGTVDVVSGPTQPLIDALIAAQGLIAPSKNPKDRESLLNLRTRQDLKDRGLTLLADIDIGGDTLHSVTALRKFNSSQRDADADFTGADILFINESFRSRFFSQELTFNGQIDGGDRGNYVLGAFYSNEDVGTLRDFNWRSQGQAYVNALLFASAGLPPGTAFAAPGQWDQEQIDAKNLSYAAFTHVDLKLGDRWNLIVGARYSREKKQGAFFYPFYRPQLNDAFRILGVSPAPAFDSTNTDKALSGTVGLQYRPSDDAMLYLTYNRGFKAGGVILDPNGAGTRANNPAEVPGAVPRDPRYKPEKVDAFEAGLKLGYLDGRARTNLAFFYNRIKDFQVAQFIGLRFTVLNAPKAESYGAEIDSSFKLSDTVTLNAAGTWLPKAEFGTSALVGAPLSGRRFSTAPKLAANASLSLDQPVTSDLALTARVQVQYTSAVFTNTATNGRQGSLALVNGNLGIKSLGGGWLVEAYVQNLFDKFYLTQHFATPLQTGDSGAYVGAPRTYGISLRGTF